MATAVSYRNHEEPPVSPIQTEFSSPNAQRISRNDGDFGSMSPVSPIMSRRASVDSDRHSTGSGLVSGLPANPTNVNPAPAYVASTAASRVVSEHRASQDPPSSESEEDGGRKDDIQFSAQALALVNAFLDQLLYSFLSASRSTSLLALRPAVTEVLKHRLAKDAISSADEELADLLPGVEDEEDVDTQHRSQEEQRQWDLELVWKRTRLRVMVYIQLGEMENEDEQRYVQEEGLFYASERRFTSSTGLVSWSAAIFLTSVLEYVAEQTLQVAGQAAHTRARRQSRTHRRSMSSDVMKLNDFMVEEHDVEKVALNPILGRLWRTWRKSLRNTAAASSSIQPSSPATSRTSRPGTGMGTAEEFTTPREGSVANESRPTTSHQQDDIPEMDHPEYVLAANIPLPMWGEARDIDEIMVEGLARDMDEEVDAVDFTDSPYPEYMLAVLVGLPFVEEKRDVDEIEVPGLARDPDAEEEDSSWLLVSKELMRRRSFSDYLTHRALPATDEDATSLPIEADSPLTPRPRSMSHSMPARKPMFVEDEIAEIPPAEDGTVEQGKVQEQDLEEVPLDGPANAEGEASQGLEADTKEPQDAAAHTEKDQHEAPKPDSEADADKAEFPWMAAGAGAAAATAVGATAVALASSNKSDEPKDADIPEDSLAGVSGEKLKAPPAVARSVSGAEKEAVPLSPSEKDVEELDKRKSLLKIKDMMVVNGRSGETSGEQSPEADNDSASNYSVDLDSEKEVVQSGEESLQNDKDEMGVARGVDITEIVEAPSPDAEMQQARGLGQRPADINIDAAAKQPDDDATQSSSPRTPRQFLDLTDDDDPSTDAPPLPAATAATAANDLSASNGVASIANKPQQENASPSRSTAASVHKKQSSDSGVQEHPMVQRLASLKGSESGSASASEKAAPATSAAIRGPEDFDQLIQNGETLKYTLTPEHVRDEPIDGQTRYVDHPSPVEMDATSPARELTSPVDNRTGRAVTSEGKTSTAEKRRSQSRPTPTNTSSTSKSGLMAREPRVATESTRDFADFIRSTGPDKDATVSPLMRNASQTSLHSLRSAHIRGASASRSSSPGRDPNGGLRDDGDVPPVPRIARRHKTGMEARGAKIVGNGSSDLIDFIRAGPKQDGEHRISRSVAPFRTTMDSDRFNDAGADGLLDPSLRTTPSFSKASSQGTSANSRSALLNPSNGISQAVQPASNGTSSRATDNLTAPDAGNGAAKKQYRNKDPYAIDFDFDDDDDEDFIIDTPRGGQKDESFLEFLRNHEPVSNEPIRPLIDPNSAQARRIINNARSGNVPVDGRRAMPTTTVSRNGSQPSASSKQAQINSTVSSPKRKLEAKSPGSKSRANTSSLNTNDLAHFIRNSGPPDDPDTAPAPEVGRMKLSEKDRKKAEKQKRGSIFSRGKTQRYLDMP